MTFCRVADFQSGETGFRRFDDRKQRVECDHLRHGCAREGERGAADFGGLVHDAVPRGAQDAALAFGDGLSQQRFRHLELGFEIHGFELWHVALFDQLAARFELGLALVVECGRLLHLRFARVVGEYGEDIAFLHMLAALDPHFGEHTAGTRRDRHLLVRLGAA